MSGPSVNDLFCGLGGLTYGLEEAGLSVNVGIDWEDECRYPYEENTNSKFVKKDIRELTADELNEYYGEDDTKILVGCAPCQPFSDLNNTNNGNKAEHEKWGMLYAFAELIEQVSPAIVSMENVPGVEGTDPYEEFKTTLERNGYYVFDKPIYAPKYDIPQNRKRMVLLASRLGPIELKSPINESEDEYPTVRETIGPGSGLEEIEAGEQSDTDHLHKSRGLSKKNIKRIRSSTPGGTWEDWDKELRADCHRKDSGSSFKSSYSRMEWDKVAPTITTRFFNYGSGRFGHPEQDRALSLREGAMLQTFPKDYSFVPDEEDVVVQSIGRMIGNAVPVKLGEIIGESIIRHLDGKDPQRQLNVYND
ncbi:DNA cytosine methyltransferase [Natrinema thermotolerans]